MIDHPDVLILFLGLEREALILEMDVLELRLVDIFDDFLAVFIHLRLGRDLWDLNTNYGCNLVESILSFEIDCGLLFHFFFAFFPFATFCLSFYLFLCCCCFARGWWRAIWTALQFDLRDPCLQLSGTYVSQLIITYRVQVPEAFVDEIKDVWIQLKCLLIILE